MPLRPLATVCLLSFASLGVPSSNSSSHAASPWQLTWSDEFNTPDNSTPDPQKWTYDLGGNGFGNHELESYTSRPENAKIVGGNLVITARHEQYTGASKFREGRESGPLSG